MAKKVKLKKSLKIDGKRHAIKSCSTSMAAAKKVQKEIKAKGYTSRCVKRDGKVCTTQGPKSKVRPATKKKSTRKKSTSRRSRK